MALHNRSRGRVLVEQGSPCCKQRYLSPDFTIKTPNLKSFTGSQVSTQLPIWLAGNFSTKRERWTSFPSFFKQTNGLISESSRKAEHVPNTQWTELPILVNPEELVQYVAFTVNICEPETGQRQAKEKVEKSSPHTRRPGWETCQQ